jgi:putative SOS response-associated peptidase YedK
MCTLYRIASGPEEIARVFGARDASTEWKAEVYPKYPAPVVRSEDAGRVLETMRWGFPPPPSGRAPVVNVRNLASPFWRGALKDPARRCLVPGNAFTEWEDTGAGKRKRWFGVNDQPLFAFAGLWRPTQEGAVFAFLTTEPNALVAPIHPKAMPVVLLAEDHDAWLGAPLAEAVALAAPYPSQLMTIDAGVSG